MGRTSQVALMAWLVVLAANSPGASLSDAELERLQHGEVLVENARTSESGGSVRVRALLHVDVETVWNYIASCEHVFAYVDGMQQCELLEVTRKGGADISKVRQVVDKGWLVPEMDFTMQVRREPHSRVDFHLLEGNLDNMQGSWTFETLGGELGLLVTHDIQVQPSFPVPRWLIRRNMRKGIPDMLACLRGLTAEPPGAAREEDLDRCPDNRKRQADAS